MGAALDADRPMEKEFADLRREIVEARNLVIKNDNLLKNLGADLKAFGKRQELFERKQWSSSAAAYALFAVLCAGAALVGARGYVVQARDQATDLSHVAERAERAAEAAKGELAAARKASADAFFAYQKLETGTEDQREQAVQALALLDRTKLSELELRALNDRSAVVLEHIAAARLESGKAAFRSRDFRTAANDLEKALRLFPNHPEADANSFLLGVSAVEVKDPALAAESLQRFVDRVKGKTNKDYALYLLGMSLEQIGDRLLAETTFRRGIAEYPESEYVGPMRRHLSNLKRVETGTVPAPPTAPAVAVQPKPPPAATEHR